MKRSTAITLGLVGCGLAIMVGTSFEGDDSVAAGAFESVDQCAAGGTYGREACQKALAEARAEHLRSAPQYAKREDCEAEFGANACAPLPADPAAGTQPGTSAGSVFVPAMAGFLLANALNSGFRAQPLYRPCADFGTISSDPRCRGASSGFSSGSSSSAGHWLYASNGARVASAPGSVAAERSSFGGSRVATLSRGGFGAHAAAHAAS